MKNNIPVKLIGDTATPGDTSGDDSGNGGTTDPTPSQPDEKTTPSTPDVKPTPTPTPSKPDAKPTTTQVKPAKKGTIFTVSSKKIKVKVTSSSRKNPTVTVTKITDKKAKNLTIPATVKVKGVTYKVTGIADKAFKNNKKLTTVTIGKNVKKVGKEVFSGCTKLAAVKFDTKLTTIGEKAFYKCTKLTNATVPKNVKTINASAFADCTNLKKITVTAGKLKTISKNAFKGINKKATITVKGTKKVKAALKKQLKKKSIGYVKTWKIK